MWRGDWVVIAVHVWSKTLTKIMIVFQCVFQIVGVVVCIVKELTRGTVGVSGSGGVTGEGVPFVEVTPVMGTWMVF